MKSVLASALMAVVLGASLSAQADAIPPEKQIELRQAGFSYMSWSMGKIKAQVIDQSVAYDQQQILAAANTLNAVAHSGMGALFGPGTEQQVGDVRTRAKPELFENFDDVGQIYGKLGAATEQLVAAATADDQAAIRTAFAEVGKNCKACHDKYRLPH